MPAGDSAALPAGQGVGGNAKLLCGFGTPLLALLAAAQVALGILAGLHAGLPPADEFPRNGGDGAPSLAGNLGTAEQNHIGLPAVGQVQADQTLHLAAAQGLAKGGLGFLAQHGHVGVVQAGQVDLLGLLRLWDGCAAAVVDQQTGTGPVLQGTFGSLHAGQAQGAGHGAGVGVTGLQQVQRCTNGIAVRLCQVRNHQLRYS